MNTDLKSRLHHPQQLGFYDHKNEPQVYPDAGETHNVVEVTVHEMAHKWLAERSTVGLFMNLMMKYYESIAETRETDNPQLTKLVQAINEATRLCLVVHEGYASYVEFRLSRRKSSLRNFVDMLKGERPPIYLEGFRIANLIDSIIRPEELADYREVEVRFISICTLLDITRFALNIPIPSELNTVTFLSGLEKNPPKGRWKTVLNSLASDADLRRNFLEQSDYMFKHWIKSVGDSFGSDGKYKGISYGDHIENTVARLFPELPYYHPGNFPLTKIITDSKTTENESSADYLLRENCTELLFLPSNRIVHVPEIEETALSRRFHELNSAGEGCYVRFIPAPEDKDIEVHIGSESDDVLTVPSGRVAAFVHEAFFSFNREAKRIWNYKGYGYSGIVAKTSLTSLLSSLSWNDALVVFEYNPDLFENPFWPEGFRNVKSPLYLVPKRVGSLASIVYPFSHYKLSSDASFLIMKNWSHFRGAGNDQIFLVWLIAQKGSVSVLNFASEASLEGLHVWEKNVGIPASIKLYKAPELGIVRASETSDIWLPISKGGEIEAPMNSDVVTSHSMSFGW